MPFESIPAYFISLLIAVAAFVTVFSWPPSKAKTVFLLFVGVLVFFPVAFVIVGMFAFNNRYVRSSYYLYILLTNIYPLLVSILLLVYAVVHGRNVNSSSAFVKTVDPRQWDLNLEFQNQISLMRRREWAFLIDFFLPFIPFLIAGGITSIVGGDKGSPAEAFFSFTLAFAISVGWIYWVFKDSFGGRSLGKWFADLRVVNAKDGRPIGPGQSFKRNWIFLIPFFPLIELGIASARKDKMRLGDLLAETCVVVGPPNYYHGNLVLDPRKAMVEKLRDLEPADPFAD